MPAASSPQERVLDISPRMRFLARLNRVLGNGRILWTPDATGSLRVKDDSPSRRTFTHAPSAPLARLRRLGDGYALTFASASTQYATSPDTANLSFGTGAADAVFSLIVVANVTNTAAARTLVSKYTTSNREWLFTITAADLLQLVLTDESAAVSASRASNAAISQGSWRVFGASYAGTGGATAANGITLYQDSAVITSTATNNASYVAMENLADQVELGTSFSHTLNHMDGQIALVAACAKNLSAADHAAIYKLCRGYFKI